MGRIYLAIDTPELQKEGGGRYFEEENGFATFAAVSEKCATTAIEYSHNVTCLMYLMYLV